MIAETGRRYPTADINTVRRHAFFTSWRRLTNLVSVSSRPATSIANVDHSIIIWRESRPPPLIHRDSRAIHHSSAHHVFNLCFAARGGRRVGEAEPPSTRVAD